MNKKKNPFCACSDGKKKKKNITQISILFFFLFPPEEEKENIFFLLFSGVGGRGLWRLIKYFSSSSFLRKKKSKYVYKNKFIFHQPLESEKKKHKIPQNTKNTKILNCKICCTVWTELSLRYRESSQNY